MFPRILYEYVQVSEYKLYSDGFYIILYYFIYLFHLLLLLLLFHLLFHLILLHSI